MHFPQGSGIRAHHNSPSRCVRPGGKGVTRACPYGSVASTASLACPAPDSTRKFPCRWVSDHLSHLWLGHHLRKVREPSTDKLFRAGSGARLVHVLVILTI